MTEISWKKKKTQSKRRHTSFSFKTNCSWWGFLLKYQNLSDTGKILAFVSMRKRTGSWMPSMTRSTAIVRKTRMSVRTNTNTLNVARPSHSLPCYCSRAGRLKVRGGDKQGGAKMKGLVHPPHWWLAFVTKILLFSPGWGFPLFFKKKIPWLFSPFYQFSRPFHRFFFPHHSRVWWLHHISEE